MNILAEIIEQLENSTETRWTESDDVDEWATHANKMNDAITCYVPLLKKLSQNLDEKDKRIAELEAALAEKDKLISIVIQQGQKALEPQRSIDLDK